VKKFEGHYVFEEVAHVKRIVVLVGKKVITVSQEGKGGLIRHL
jgi:hypothetical protein